MDSRKVKRKYSDVVHVTEIKKGQQDKNTVMGMVKNNNCNVLILQWINPFLHAHTCMYTSADYLNDMYL